MRGLLLFLCFLFTLPFLAAAGHDIWHAMNDKNGLDFSKPFPFSALGWIWKTYDLDDMKMAKDMIEPEFWKEYITPLLEAKSVIVTAVPMLFFYILTGLLKLFGLPPFQGEGVFSHRMSMGKGKGGKDFTFDKIKKSKKVKYKRK
jgi:hypothetical protein